MTTTLEFAASQVEKADNPRVTTRVDAGRINAKDTVPKRRWVVAAQVGVVVALLALWEVGARSEVISTFLFSSPSLIAETIVDRAASGRLIEDIAATMHVYFLGYLIGAIFGSVLGLLLWYSRFVAEFSGPFVAAIWATPVVAIAPMTIIWFGTGVESKVVIVVFATVVISLTNSYRGAERADKDLVNLMRSFGATRNRIFRSVIVPGSLPWVLQGLKLNVGLAMVGAIVAEYISSSVGLGNMILVGSNNFSMNLVLAGIAVVIAVVWILTALMNRIESLVLKWEGKQS